MHRDRYSLLLAGFAAVLFFAGSAAAQLAGSDVGPGDSCAGYPAGASTMTADADLDEKDVVLICDGSIWVSASGSGGTLGDLSDVSLTASGLPLIEDFQASSSGGASTGNSTPFTLTAPAGITADELLLIIVGSDYDGSTQQFTDNVAGWNLLGQSGSGSSDAHIGVYWRAATGSEGNVDVTTESDENVFGWYIRISGANTSTPFDGSNFGLSGNETSHTVPGFMTTAADTLAIFGLSFDGGDGNTFTVSGTGWAEEDEQTSGTGGGDGGGVWGSNGIGVPGATGDVTVDASADDGAAYFQLAIKPASSAPFQGSSLVYNSASGNWIAGGALPTAAGNNMEIQFNDNGDFGASPNLVFDNGQLILSNVGSNDGIYLYDDDGGDELVEIYSWTGHGKLKISDSNGTTSVELGPHDDITIESLYIDDDQDENVGINESSADARLEISGDGETTYPLFMASSDDGGNGDVFYISTGVAVGIGNNNPDVALDVTGDVQYTGVLTAVSDIRVKDNIKPLENPLAKLTSLHGLSYDKKSNKDSEVTEFGFAAQEVQKVFPELVRTAPDEMGTLSVNYIGLIAPMVEALKEQQAQISEQHDRLRALERENSALLRRLDAQEAGGGE